MGRSSKAIYFPQLHRPQLSLQFEVGWFLPREGEASSLRYIKSSVGASLWLAQSSFLTNNSDVVYLLEAWSYRTSFSSPSLEGYSQVCEVERRQELPVQGEADGCLLATKQAKRRKIFKFSAFLFEQAVAQPENTICCVFLLSPRSRFICFRRV